MQNNVYAWVQEVVGELQPQAPVLEVGSLNVNGTVRDLFPTPYTGLDMQDGLGVDVVGNVETHGFAADEFSTVVCTETLEHVQRPWLAVVNMAYWLKPGGYLIVTAPFQHEVHNHPADYWRFTDQGLRQLFDDAGLTTVKTAIDGATAYGVAQR